MPTHAPASSGILFRVAAGPRQGYGHLVRATVVARAMGVPARVVIRGGRQARRVAQGLGCDLVDGTAAGLARGGGLALLVIDDPCRRESERWCRAFRRAGVKVASIHDLGTAYCGADLTIDGSVTQRGRRPEGPSLLGPRFAILKPVASGTPRTGGARRVLVALGGGPRLQVGLAIARAIRRRHPEVHVQIAGGFSPRAQRRTPDGVSWLATPSGLSRAIGDAAVVVTGGGVTLYEACSAGAAAVGVAVVPAQRPTIDAFARRGAALDGGTTRRIGTAVRLVSRVIEQAARGRELGRRGRRLIDGRGASRVARALLALGGHAKAREEQRP